MITIGITGTNRAGKGTVAKFLVERFGFRHYSSSDFIKEWMDTIDRKIKNREDLIWGGNELRRLHGAAVIAKSLFHQAEIAGLNAVIESVRNPEEAVFIKSLAHGFIWSVDADPVIRYGRAKNAGSLKDGVTIEEFIRQEEKEMNSPNSSAQNIRKCMDLADFEALNNSDLPSLYRLLEGEAQEIGINGSKERKY